MADWTDKDRGQPKSRDAQKAALDARIQKLRDSNPEKFDFISPGARATPGENTVRSLKRHVKGEGGHSTPLLRSNPSTEAKKGPRTF